MPDDSGHHRASDRSHRPRRALVAAVVCALVTIVPLTSAGATNPQPEKRPRLLVIGDSIILGTGDRIAQALPGWDVTVDAAESRSTVGGLETLHRHGTDFTVVVIELGANDGGTPSVFTPRVTALFDALGGVPHVVWLTIPEARPYYRQANAIIRAEADKYPNATVADWSDAVGPGDVVGDGLHLTPQGYDDMAVWVAGVVEDARTPPTTTVARSTTTSEPATMTTEPSETHSRTTEPIGVRSEGSTDPDSRSGSPTAGVILGVGAMAVIVVLVVVATRRRNRF